MKQYLKKIFAACICIAAIGLLVGCSTGKKPKTITFADVGWDSILFHNAVAGTIAEKVFGYEWTELAGSTPITHEAVKKGEIDVHMEVWTDNLPDYSGDLARGELTELGINFDDNAQGFYVPRYVIEGDTERGIAPMAPNLKHVADLKDYPALFKDPEDRSKGIIYGGIAGWSITEIMHKKYLHYGLNKYYNYLEPGTDAATSAVLVSAYDRGEAVVAYYWEPTWLLGLYDFILLEDEPYNKDTYFEGKCVCPSVVVTVCASNQFYADNPEFCDFLAKYRTSSALTSKALAHIQDTGDNYAEAAIWFITNHQDLVKSWLTKDQATKLFDAI